MDSDYELLEAACYKLSELRRTCMGEPLPLLPRDQWPTRVENAEQFKALVSQVYMQWYESWLLDVNFLAATGREEGRVLRDFTSVIRVLRTADQHSGTTEAVDEQRRTWLTSKSGQAAPATPQDWSVCGSALMAELTSAVEAMTKLASVGRVNRRFRETWRAKCAPSIQSAVSRVAADLGLNLPQKSREYHERNVKSKWSRVKLQPTDDHIAILDSHVERSLLSDLSPLPCKYIAILEKLDIVGTANAGPALRLAHAVADVSPKRGEEFVELVASVWDSIKHDAA